MKIHEGKKQTKQMTRQAQPPKSTKLKQGITKN